MDIQSSFKRIDTSVRALIGQVKLSGKPAIVLSLVVLVNLVLCSVWFVSRSYNSSYSYTNLIGAHNFLPLFHKTDKVLFLSRCDSTTVTNVTRVMSHTHVYFSLQECLYSRNYDVPSVNMKDDLSYFDAVFIDVDHIGMSKLLETLIRFHTKPTKYLVVYNQTLMESTWTSDMAEVGDILDDFMETHVRWQIDFEPFLNKDKSHLEDRVFLLRGETQQAWDDIQQHQFPISCKDQNYLVAEYWTYGWGSYITTTWRTLELTAQYNKTMLLTNYWTTYAKYEELNTRVRQFCGSSLPDCYYLKLSNCTLGDAIDALHRSYGLVNDWQGAAVNKDVVKDPVVFVKGHPYDVTARAWTHGEMWNESRYIDDETYPYFFQFMRNRRYVREVMYDRISSLNLHSRPYVGIHIRHGDKHLESGAFRHLGYYIDEAKKIVSNSLCVNVSNCPFNMSQPIPMFVMTDDETELNQTQMFPDVEILYFSTTRHKGQVQHMFTDEQNKNRTETFLTLTTELEIMSKAQVYVGTGNSNLSNLLVKIFYRNKPGGLAAKLHTLVQGREDVKNK